MASSEYNRKINVDSVKRNNIRFAILQLKVQHFYCLMATFIIIIKDNALIMNNNTVILTNWYFLITVCEPSQLKLL